MSVRTSASRHELQLVALAHCASRERQHCALSLGWAAYIYKAARVASAGWPQQLPFRASSSASRSASRRERLEPVNPMSHSHLDFPETCCCVFYSSRVRCRARGYTALCGGLNRLRTVRECAYDDSKNNNKKMITQVKIITKKPDDPFDLESRLGASPLDSEGGRRFHSQMTRLYELIARIEEPYQTRRPLSDAEDQDAREILVELRSYARFVTPLCGVLRPLVPTIWMDWQSNAPCQECGDAVSSRWRGLQCQAGGHRLCWRCIASTIAWNEPRIVAFGKVPVEDRPDNVSAYGNSVRLVDGATARADHFEPEHLPNAICHMADAQLGSLLARRKSQHTAYDNG